MRPFPLSPSPALPRDRLSEIQVDVPEMDLAETKAMGNTLRRLRLAAARLYSYGLDCDDIAMDLADSLQGAWRVDLMMMTAPSGVLLHVLLRRRAVSPMKDR